MITVDHMADNYQPQKTKGGKWKE